MRRRRASDFSIQRASGLDPIGDELAGRLSDRPDHARALAPIARRLHGAIDDCLSRREEPFWRDNADPASIPGDLQELLAQWRYRPPGRFDFTLDLESFAFFNYQYILYGMDYRTDLSGGRGDFPNMAAAEKLFARIRNFSERATEDLPTHRALIRAING